jgi:prolactin regulatory element-binding protein
LQPLLTILKAHEGFPTACLQFNPSSSLLISGSADNSARVVTIPSNLSGACGSGLFFLMPHDLIPSAAWQTVISWLVAIIVVLLAFAAQSVYSSR